MKFWARMVVAYVYEAEDHWFPPRERSSPELMAGSERERFRQSPEEMIYGAQNRPNTATFEITVEPVEDES